MARWFVVIPGLSDLVDGRRALGALPGRACMTRQGDLAGHPDGMRVN